MRALVKLSMVNGADVFGEKNMPWYFWFSGCTKPARYMVRMLFHSSGTIVMSTPTALKLGRGRFVGQSALRATLRPLTIHVGTAPDSWGVWFVSDPRQTPWQRFLDEVAEAGYDAIELGPFGYLPTEPQRVADELAKRSLQLAGGTISVNLASPEGWQGSRATTSAVCDVLEYLGAHFLVLLDAAPVDTVAGPRVLDESGW